MATSLHHETAVSSLCPEECGFVHSVGGTSVPHACGLVLHVCGACMWVVCGSAYVCMCMGWCVHAWAGVYMHPVLNLVPLCLPATTVAAVVVAECDLGRGGAVCRNAVHLEVSLKGCPSCKSQH